MDRERSIMSSAHEARSAQTSVLDDSVSKVEKEIRSLYKNHFTKDLLKETGTITKRLMAASNG